MTDLDKLIENIKNDTAVEINYLNSKIEALSMQIVSLQSAVTQLTNQSLNTADAVASLYSQAK